MISRPADLSIERRQLILCQNGEVHVARVEEIVPAEGEVRVLLLTALQFARMRLFIGKSATPVEKPPNQLSFW